MINDDERAEQISARLAAATPGPWSVLGGARDHRDTLTVYFKYGDRSGTDRGLAERTNTQLVIANAPADLAWLLAERERLMQRLFDLGQDA